MGLWVFVFVFATIFKSKFGLEIKKKDIHWFDLYLLWFIYFWCWGSRKTKQQVPFILCLIRMPAGAFAFIKSKLWLS